MRTHESGCPRDENGHAGGPPGGAPDARGGPHAFLPGAAAPRRGPQGSALSGGGGDGREVKEEEEPNDEEEGKEDELGERVAEENAVVVVIMVVKRRLVHLELPRRRGKDSVVKMH